MADKIVQISFFGGTANMFEQVAEIVKATEIPTKLNHIKSKPKLADVIEHQDSQLIIGMKKQKGFDVFEIPAMIKEAGSIIPVLGLSEEADVDVPAAMEKGLNDFLHIEHTEHLKFVIQRELKVAQYVLQLNDSIKPSAKDFTGLSSRLQFLEYIKTAIPERFNNSGETAIVYLQLDNFAWINETYGILAGDTFLRQTAEIITSMLEEQDIGARYQGGSFILLLEGNDLKHISEKSEKIKTTIGEAVSNVDDNVISSTCSVGIRLIAEHFEPVQEIISASFAASEVAKSNGGDSCHVHKVLSETAAYEEEKHAWNARIREAYDKDMFSLFYQPIVSLQGDTKPRYEVLLRMVDKGGDVISPGTFLPFAERSGLMADIDRRVIHHALDKLLDEHQKGNEFELFIKLSGKSLDDKNMASWIANAIRESGVPSESLIFEITESLALTHLSQARRIIDSLRKVGCKVAIDHFGTRHKSLKLFKLIKFDYLKVDGSLVGQLQTNANHQIIVKKICNLAKKHGLHMVAESVQDVNNLPIIWQYGFDMVQGYFLQIPAAETDYDFSNLLI